MALVPNTEQNQQRCICGTCPSYPAEGGFFCATGKSAKEIDRRGCVCADCENFKEFALTKGYYCAEGSAEQIEA